MSAPIESLRRRLVWRLIPALFAVIAVGGVTSYFVARHSADFAYDQALLAAAADIASGVDDVDGRVSFDLSAQSERILRSDERDDLFFAVRLDDGTFLGGDRDLTSGDPVPPADAVSSERTFRGRTLRSISLTFSHGSTPFVVTVAETTRKRQAAGWTAFAQMVIPTTCVLLLACLIVWLSVRGGLAPLAALQAEIEARSEYDLSPIATVGAPFEVRSLVRAINRLLDRLDAATHAHKSFVADAAHQLRTPLAGIQAQVDLLALTATPNDDRTLDRLRASVARAVRLSNQLLALARSDEDARALALQALDVAELIGDAADAWVHRAIAVGVDLGFDLRHGRVRGDPYLLRESLDNLIDNALRHVPPGGAITVATASAGSDVEITVDDSGPGIAPTLRERVFERFYREAQDHASGSGLGLAIVRQIAQRHGGEVEALESPTLGGARLRMRLPALDDALASTTARNDTNVDGAVPIDESRREKSIPEHDRPVVGQVSVEARVYPKVEEATMFTERGTA